MTIKTILSNWKHRRPVHSKNKNVFVWLCFLLTAFGQVSCFDSKPFHPIVSEPVFEPSPKAEPEKEPTQAPLKITVLDVGQGDATLVQTPTGKTLLIDAGPSGAGKNKILPYLRAQQIQQLDGLVITHYDADHFAGLSDLIAAEDGMIGTADDIQIVTAYDRGGSPLDSSPFYPVYAGLVEGKRQVLNVGDLLESTKDSSLNIRCVSSGGAVWNGARFELVDLLLKGFHEPENSSSVGLLIEYGTFRYLTAGDLTGGGSPGGYETIDVESELARSVGPVTVVHANHHGSASSSNAIYTTTLKPQFVVLSVGDGNTYHHPNQEVLERWQAAGAELWLTAKGSGGFIKTEHVQNGPITVESDGSTTVLR